MKFQATHRGRREYGKEIPWQCLWRSAGELSGPFCLEPPYFHVWFPHIALNCSRERSPEHCHSKSFLVPEVKEIQGNSSKVRGCHFGGSLLGTSKF